MNTDRFLTRVFDKQEKKMIYVGDQFLLEKELYVFYTCDHIFMYIEQVHRMSINSPPNKIILISFADRFIPMQCLGALDKKEKLIYEGDIVESHNKKYLTYLDDESCAFWFKRLDNECEILLFDFGCDIEIIGNIYESKELMERRV